MKKTELKLKVYKVILICLIIIAIITGILIIIKYGRNQVNEKNTRLIVNEIMQQENNVIDENQVYQIEGYNIIGIIQIPTIELEYPIIDICDKKSMKVSVGKYWGGNVNENGNLSLAAHNNKDGTMFGKTKYLKIGDEIFLTDMKKNKVRYEIYDIFSVEPNDVTILETIKTDVKEVTLITCTNGNKNRLVIKANEKTL